MYETIRHRITRFEEASPEERKELFERVWKLREHVEGNQDNFPKPGAAFLHDALTHAVLFFIGVYELEWERSSNEAASPEPAELEAVKRRREEMKAATERISA